MTALLEDRQRIGDDLHDLVSQELFAAAIQLESLGERVPAEFRSALAGCLEHVKRAQREVRGVVSTLDNERTSEPLSARLRREIILAQDALGFAPEVAGRLVGDSRRGGDGRGARRRPRRGHAREPVERRAARERVPRGDRPHVDGERLTVTVTDDGIGPPDEYCRHSGTSNLANRALRRAGSFSLEKAHPDETPPGSIMRWTVRWGTRS